MLRNYLAAVLRNAMRNRLHAVTNIAGLALGFAAAMFIGLYVRDEFSYDKWMPDYGQVFMITETLEYAGRSPLQSHRVPLELAASLKLDFPQIESIARLANRNVSLRAGEIEANEKIYWADPGIFGVLRLPAVAGDLITALDAPDGVVVTRRVARKYFGDRDPIGATLEVDRQHQLRVTAVIEDLPSNTHLDAEIFGSGRASFSFLSFVASNPYAAWSWASAGYTYLRLAPGASARDLEKAMPAYLDRRMMERIKNFERVSLWVTPIDAIHLQADTGTTAMRPPSDPAVAYALAAIGGLILLVAGINFVNLMTARATRRAVEVGVRKVTGAERRNLIVQFLSESILYAAMSALIAVAALEALMPAFNSFLDRSIALDYLSNPMLGASLSGGVVLIGVLAGFYPAFVLSAFRPAAALKTQFRLNDSGHVRKALVTIQFAILIGLIVGVTVVYRQSLFALNEGLRLDEDQVVLVASACKTAFPERVRALPGVRAAACSQRNGLTFGSQNGAFQRDGGQPISLANHTIDFGYLELYGQTPLAGRFFSREHAGDASPFSLDNPVGPNIVINETAARRFGFASPAEAVGQGLTVALPGAKTAPRFEIVGVVRDFSFDSVHSAIQPGLYFIQPELFQWLSIKLSGNDLPATLEAIDTLWKETGEPRPITRLFLDQEMAKVYLGITRQSQLFGAFSAVAIFIASLGLFGLATFVAEQRTKEIGVRKTMGATKVDILRLILWQFTKPVLWANVIAWPVAYVIMQRWLEDFAYHIDLAPWMFLAATAAGILIALATVIGHALFVARAHPVSALRYE